MNKSHGSPYDRGAADCWYGRPPDPHKRDKLNYRITDLTAQERAEYFKGYAEADAAGEFRSKAWE
jgi:hypothetical protein